MKQVIEKYYCDVCAKEVKSKEFKYITVPCKFWDCEGKSFSKGERKIEVCDECANAFFDITMQHFAEVNDCYGITAKVKYKEHEDE